MRGRAYYSKLSKGSILTAHEYSISTLSTRCMIRKFGVHSATQRATYILKGNATIVDHGFLIGISMEV